MANKISLEMLNEWYREFNNEFFNNELPNYDEIIIGFDCFKSPNTMGQCTEMNYGNTRVYSIILNFDLLGDGHYRYNKRDIYSRDDTFVL